MKTTAPFFRANVSAAAAAWLLSSGVQTRLSLTPTTSDTSQHLCTTASKDPRHLHRSHYNYRQRLTIPGIHSAIKPACLISRRSSPMSLEELNGSGESSTTRCSGSTARETWRAWRIFGFLSSAPSVSATTAARTIYRQVWVTSRSSTPLTTRRLFRRRWQPKAATFCRCIVCFVFTYTETMY